MFSVFNKIQILFIFFSFFGAYSQNNTVTNFKIYRISEISDKNTGKNKKTAAKILNFITGKENTVPVTPVSVTLDNKNVVWFADRGLGYPVTVNKKNSIKIPDVFIKSKTEFPSLVDICNGKPGDILFTDSKNNKAYIFNESNKEIRNLCKKYNLQQPTGITFLEKKNEIWISETSSHKIAIFDYEGNFIKSMGKRGAARGEFNFPTFIRADDIGNVYIVDALNFRIQIFDENGNFINSFGEQGDASGYFARPKGIAVDSFGNIYVVDALFHAVQIFDKSGNFLYSFGKQGRKEGEFWLPSGIFIDKKDNIYIADSYNSRIQIFKIERN